MIYFINFETSSKIKNMEVVAGNTYYLASDAHARSYECVGTEIRKISCVMCSRNPMVAIQGCSNITNTHA